MYKVILIESGHVTRSWLYGDSFQSALKQLAMLLDVYQEVNEVFPFLLKMGAYDYENTPVEDYINSLIKF